MKNDALEEAQKMMAIPMKDLPPLALDFLEYIASKYGVCSEVCLTAYAVYNQVVLNMPCDDPLYILNDEDEIKWWENEGFPRMDFKHNI